MNYGDYLLSKAKENGNEFYTNEEKIVWNTDSGNKDFYAPCGCNDFYSSTALTLLTTLPLFENLNFANKDLLLSPLILNRKFYAVDLNKVLDSPEHTIEFFEKELTAEREYRPVTAFLVQPEQMEKLINLVREADPTKSKIDLTLDILQRPQSLAHKNLLDRTVKKLHQFESQIVDSKLEKAKEAFLSFHLLDCLSHLFTILPLKVKTYRLIEALKKIDKDIFMTKLADFGGDYRAERSMTLKAKGMDCYKTKEEWEAFMKERK